MNVPRQRMHTKANRCPICKGAKEDQAGKGKRCWGFTSADGDYAHCTREELAGDIEQGNDQAYAHKLHGPCKCGTEHGPAQGFKSASSKQTEAEYDYRDEHGTVLFQVVRVPGGKFFQRKPDGADGWIWSLGETKRVLYKLPEILGRKTGRTVYIVEGERDVLTMERLGEVATTNPGGAGKWQGDVAECAREFLAGADVVMIPDNDAAGRKHEAQVSAALRGVVSSWRTVYCPAPYKDITDVVEAGLTLKDVLDQPAPSDEGHMWRTQLPTDKQGNLANTYLATLLIIRHVHGNDLAMDEMTKTPFYRKRPLQETDIHNLRSDIETAYKISPSVADLTAAILVVATDHSFHPLADYLGSLRWDGASRIDRVAHEVLNIAAPTPLERRMLRCFFISAVARALLPGCKVDTVLVLFGKQGDLKSSFFKALAGEWFSDSAIDLRTKDAMLQIHAAWIYEWAEIDKVTLRVESSTAKAFLTSAVDNLRPPFGKHVVKLKRSGVVVGTTNRPFLSDDTGNRRYHPLSIGGRVRVDLVAEWRDQLWAEAVAAYKAGETWYLTAEEETERERVSEEHTEENAWLGEISKYVASQEMINPGKGVLIADVWTGAFSEPLSRCGKSEETRIGHALRTLGLVSRRGTDRKRRYHQPSILEK